MAVRRQANSEGVQKGYKGGTKGVQRGLSPIAIGVVIVLGLVLLFEI